MLHTEWPFHYLNGYFLTIPYEFFSLPQQPHLPTAPSLSEGNRCLIYKSAKFPPFSSWSVVCMLYLICNRYLISCHTRIALFHFTICRGREFHTRVLFLPYCNTKKLPLTFSACILWYTKKLVTSNFSYILWYLQDLSLAASYKCIVLKKESGNNLPEPFYIF